MEQNKGVFAWLLSKMCSQNPGVEPR